MHNKESLTLVYCVLCDGQRVCHPDLYLSCEIMNINFLPWTFGPLPPV